MWEEIALFVAIGFLAQMVDGAIGMAYGITATSVLLSNGIPPVTASACVHAAEVFTTAASGAAHWRLGNVDRGLVLRLAVPGMIGGALGAYILTELPGDLLRPWIAAYLLALGVVIIYRALRPRLSQPPRLGMLAPLGFCGGMMDSIGGGGWGAIVTSSLLGMGTPARTTIGSVSLSEFFVTTTISATFMMTIGLSLWPIIAGLIVGGVLAAPFAALAARHLPQRVLMIAVGVVVIVLSSRILLKSVM